MKNPTDTNQASEDELKQRFATLFYDDNYEFMLSKPDLFDKDRRKQTTMKIFSTFSGIGGFEVGIQNALESNRKTQQTDADTRHSADDTSYSLQEWGQSATCVGYSEIDKYAIKVYERNFPNVRNYGDITKINAKELPDFDCLVGGFPCQAFSIAGKRRGFDDTRGTLFFDLARILREKQPRYFVFENVKGLVSHDQGNTFRTIITTIDELGYDCQWSVLNSKNFGVPQNRERVYIVGHLRGSTRPEVFPLESNYGETANEVTDKGQLVGLTRREPNNYRERKDGRAGTLDANYYKGLANQERPGVAIPVLTPDRIEKRQNGRRFKENGEPAFTVTSADRHGVYDGVKIRRLTPIECERLQGFPDNWTAEGIDGPISDTQRYKMCGNAVTTNVVQAVFERILK